MSNIIFYDAIPIIGYDLMSGNNGLRESRHKLKISYTMGPSFALH